MKKLFCILSLILLLLPMLLSSCKTEEPLLISDPDETYILSDDEKVVQEGPIPKDRYLSKDCDSEFDVYVCESEDRFYFLGNPKNFEKYSGSGKKYVLYFEKESGRLRYLCAKEGCKHDSEDCNAFVSDRGLYRFALHDGKLLAALKDDKEAPTDILLMQGETDGSGFREIGKIYCDSVAAEPDMTNPEAEVYFHRDWCYVLSQKVTWEDENRFDDHHAVAVEESYRLKRFRLDNLNISEELYHEILTAPWEFTYSYMRFDQNDACLIQAFENYDEERHRYMKTGAINLYRFREGGEREELYAGELPVSLNGVRVLQGTVRILGRNYENDKAVLMRLDPEKKAFREEETFGTFEETEDYLGNRLRFGDGYILMEQGGILMLEPNEWNEQDTQTFSFFSESGEMIGKMPVNVKEAIEKLHVPMSDFEASDSFYINIFALDRENVYGALTILGAEHRYWNVLRLPVSEDEEWNPLFSEE